MKGLLIALAVAIAAATAVTAVAAAVGGSSSSQPGPGGASSVTPAPAAPHDPVAGSPGSSGSGSGTVSSPPLTASPVPAPTGIAGGALRPVPPAVVSKYDAAWGMLGTLTSVTAADDPSRSGRSAALGSFLVVGAAHHLYPDGIDRALVTVTSDTRLVRLGDNGALVPCGFGALHSGAVVAVRFSGPVAESYPVQAVAAQVVVLAD